MSDLFDEATFQVTTPADKVVREVQVERAREIARIEADSSVLARLAAAQDPNADVRVSEAAIIERADQLLQTLARNRSGDDE